MMHPIFLICDQYFYDIFLRANQQITDFNLRFCRIFKQT